MATKFLDQKLEKMQNDTHKLEARMSELEKKLEQATKTIIAIAFKTGVGL